jgi:hypothetical protein
VRPSANPKIDFPAEVLFQGVSVRATLAPILLGPRPSLAFPTQSYPFRQANKLAASDSELLDLHFAAAPGAAASTVPKLTSSHQIIFVAFLNSTARPSMRRWTACD